MEALILIIISTYTIVTYFLIREKNNIDGKRAHEKLYLKKKKKKPIFASVVNMKKSN